MQAAHQQTHDARTCARVLLESATRLHKEGLNRAFLLGARKLGRGGNLPSFVVIRALSQNPKAAGNVLRLYVLYVLDSVCDVPVVGVCCATQCEEARWTRACARANAGGVRTGGAWVCWRRATFHVFCGCV